MNAVLKESQMRAVDAQPWVEVCALEDIVPNTGVCALVHGRQIAVFRLDDSQDVFAIDNRDPNSDANVLSRGIVGCLGGRLVVASPIYKQHFDLRTGECLENTEASVRAYPAQAVAGRVLLQVA